MFSRMALRAPRRVCATMLAAGALAAGAVASLAACSSRPVGAQADDASTMDRTPPAEGGGSEGDGADAAYGETPDASTDGGVSNPDGDAGGCTDTLAHLNSSGRCPGSYAAALTSACSWSTPATPYAGTCGGLPAVAHPWGAGWFVCVYDGADAGTLVGMGQEDDVPTFCNQTSFTVAAGQVPAACMTNGPSISGQLSPVDASCPTNDAAADSPAD